MEEGQIECSADVSRSEEAKANSTQIHVYKINGQCEVCHKVASKYRCPRCALQSCSLGCSQAHKRGADCSGKRSHPTLYIPHARLTAEDLVGDQILLEEAQTSLAQLGCSPGGGRRNWAQLKAVQKYCKERRFIQLSLMPAGLGRAQHNRTYLKKEIVCWTVEWILLRTGPSGEHPANMTLNQIRTAKIETNFFYSGVPDDSTLKGAYEALLKRGKNVMGIPGPDRVELLLRQEADIDLSMEVKRIETENEALFNAEEETKKRPRMGPATRAAMEVRAAINQNVRKPLLIHNPSAITLANLLAHRTVIEYPTIYIYPKEE